MNDPKHEGQAALSARLDVPAVGGLYVHYKGGRYRLLAVGCVEATGEPFVAYQSVERGLTWMRTLANWNETVDGQPRFRLDSPRLSPPGGRP